MSINFSAQISQWTTGSTSTHQNRYLWVFNKSTGCISWKNRQDYQWISLNDTGRLQTIFEKMLETFSDSHKIDIRSAQNLLELKERVKISYTGYQKAHQSLIGQIYRFIFGRSLTQNYEKITKKIDQCLLDSLQDLNLSQISPQQFKVLIKNKEIAKHLQLDQLTKEQLELLIDAEDGDQAKNLRMSVFTVDQIQQNASKISFKLYSYLNLEQLKALIAQLQVKDPLSDSNDSPLLNDTTYPDGNLHEDPLNHYSFRHQSEEELKTVPEPEYKESAPSNDLSDQSLDISQNQVQEETSISLSSNNDNNEASNTSVVFSSTNEKTDQTDDLNLNESFSASDAETEETVSNQSISSLSLKDEFLTNEGRDENVHEENPHLLDQALDDSNDTPLEDENSENEHSESSLDKQDSFEHTFKEPETVEFQEQQDQANNQQSSNIEFNLKLPSKGPYVGKTFSPANGSTIQANESSSNQRENQPSAQQENTQELTLTSFKTWSKVDLTLYGKQAISKLLAQKPELLLTFNTPTVVTNIHKIEAQFFGNLSLTQALAVDVSKLDEDQLIAASKSLFFNENSTWAKIDLAEMEKQKVARLLTQGTKLLSKFAAANVAQNIDKLSPETFKDLSQEQVYAIDIRRLDDPQISATKTNRHFDVVWQKLDLGKIDKEKISQILNLESTIIWKFDPDNLVENIAKIDSKFFYLLKGDNKYAKAFAPSVQVKQSASSTVITGSGHDNSLSNKKDEVNLAALDRLQVSQQLTQNPTFLSQFNASLVAENIDKIEAKFFKHLSFDQVRAIDPWSLDKEQLITIENQYGARVDWDKIDLALASKEKVSHLLNKNPKVLQKLSTSHVAANIDKIDSQFFKYLTSIQAGDADLFKLDQEQLSAILTVAFSLKIDFASHSKEDISNLLKKEPRLLEKFNDSLVAANIDKIDTQFFKYLSPYQLESLDLFKLDQDQLSIVYTRSVTLKFDLTNYSKEEISDLLNKKPEILGKFYPWHVAANIGKIEAKFFKHLTYSLSPIEGFDVFRADQEMALAINQTHFFDQNFAAVDLAQVDQQAVSNLLEKNPKLLEKFAPKNVVANIGKIEAKFFKHLSFNQIEVLDPFSLSEDQTAAALRDQSFDFKHCLQKIDLSGFDQEKISQLLSLNRKLLKNLNIQTVADNIAKIEAKFLLSLSAKQVQAINPCHFREDQLTLAKALFALHQQNIDTQCWQIALKVQTQSFYISQINRDDLSAILEQNISLLKTITPKVLVNHIDKIEDRFFEKLPLECIQELDFYQLTDEQLVYAARNKQFFDKSLKTKWADLDLDKLKKETISLLLKISKYLISDFNLSALADNINKIGVKYLEVLGPSELKRLDLSKVQDDAQLLYLIGNALYLNKEDQFPHLDLDYFEEETLNQAFSGSHEWYIKLLNPKTVAANLSKINPAIYNWFTSEQLKAIDYRKLTEDQKRQFSTIDKRKMTGYYEDDQKTNTTTFEQTFASDQAQMPEIDEEKLWNDYLICLKEARQAVLNNHQFDTDFKEVGEKELKKTGENNLVLLTKYHTLRQVFSNDEAYEELEISPLSFFSQQKSVARQYKELAAIAHEDKQGQFKWGQESQSIFKAIKAAYELVCLNQND